MHSHLHLHLLIHLLFFPSLLAQPPNEIHPLLEFKKGIQDHPILSSWTQPDLSPCSWYGVSCIDNTTIISLSLANLGLSGDLKFSTLTSILSLRNLTLSGNNFTGRLVPAIGTLISLQHLDLSRNQFTGKIPSRIADLGSLTHLNLSGNFFTESLPTGIQNLQQLRELDVRSNGLWGGVEAVLAGLRNTEHVDLSGNGFSGGLVMDSGSLSSLANTLRYMNLSNNMLTGGFLSSDAVKLFRNLEVLDLSRNKLSGELPPLEALPSLRLFRAGYNLLSGMIPRGFLSSTILVELDLSGNGFTGEIQFMNSTNLKTLNLSSNALSGSLPSNIGGCMAVDLSKNMLSGDLSMMQNWGDAVEVIDLSSNTLSGYYPNEASQFGNLISIKIRNNSLAGNLPSVFERYRRLALIDLSLNKFTGPVLPSFFTSLTLTSLNLSGNFFTGTIPFQTVHSTESLDLHSVTNLEGLDLSDNLFSGSLSEEIGNMQRLKLLNLQNNNLSGVLPNEITMLSELQLLDLSSNRLEGRIPEMLQPGLKVLNVSYNNLSGTIPQSLMRFPSTSFHPGNDLLIEGDLGPNNTGNHWIQHKTLSSGLQVAFIVGSIMSAMLIFFVFMAIYRIRSQEFCGRNEPRGQVSGKNVKHLEGSLSTQKELLTELGEYDSSILNERHSFQLDVYSPDRLADELFFLDGSLVFTAEELSRAPAEVLGRSSHGTSYKATLDCGHVLRVKWLRVGLVKHKQEFAKEAKRVGTIRHPNIISWRGYYWGPREQERLIIEDYVHGDSLSLHLYESTPRRYSRLSVRQRLKITIEIARSLYHLHLDCALPHGNLKPSNIFLTGPDLTAKLADYGLHRLMTPAGTAEQMLNLGALGYRAPELTTSRKPFPSLKADVYALGVILMELLTRRSAGDIISGQAGAVDLADWVQMCTREGRGADCFDRDITGLEEDPRVMDELLSVSLRCILPVNERPNIRTVLDELSSIAR